MNHISLLHCLLHTIIKMPIVAMAKPQGFARRHDTLIKFLIINSQQSGQDYF